MTTVYWRGEFKSSEPFPWADHYKASVFWEKHSPRVMTAELRQDGVLRWHDIVIIEDGSAKGNAPAIRELRAKAIAAAKRRRAELVNEV